jgi:hypothetical protein
MQEGFFGKQLATYSRITKLGSGHLLFRIIGRVYEEPKEGTPHDPISAMNHMAVLVSINKPVIEKELPYSLHQLVFTVGIDIPRRGLTELCSIGSLKIVG